MPNILDRAKAFLKGVFRFPRERGSIGGGSWMLNGLSPDQLASLIAAVDSLGNSIVMICLGWKFDIWAEAPLRIYRQTTEDKPVIQPIRHGNAALRRLQQILKRPNELYGDDILWAGTIIGLDIDGNAYWYKLRGGLDAVIGYLYIPHHLMEPIYPPDGSVYIDHYLYSPGFSKPIEIDPKDIVHFRRGVDPKNTRKGLSRLKAGRTEIFTDEAWGMFSAAVGENMGMIGTMVSPDPAMFKIDPDYMGPDEDERKAIKQKIDAQSTHGKQGGTVVHNLPMKVDHVGADLGKLLTREQRKTAEERIPALLGVAPGVAKTGAGLDRNTMSNATFEERQSYRRGIMSLHRVITQTLDQQVLPDFTIDESYTTGFDTTGVEVLQEDKTEEETRNKIMVSTRKTVNELRAMYGDPPLPGGDTIIWPKGSAPEPPDDSLIDGEDPQGGVPAKVKPKPKTRV
jgi:hypothetical protein